MFVVFVTPVGPYFKGGFSTNPYVIIREYDRAAPHGTGIYKVGGDVYKRQFLVPISTVGL